MTVDEKLVTMFDRKSIVVRKTNLDNRADKLRSMEEKLMLSLWRNCQDIANSMFLKVNEILHTGLCI